VRGRYATAAEERIDRARTAAAAELGYTDPVPWDDIRAVYTRPPRSPWKSYTTVIGGIVNNALGAAFVLGFVGMMLVTASLSIDKDNRAEAAKTAPPAQKAAAVAAADRGLTRREKRELVFFGVDFVCVVFLASGLRGFKDHRSKMAKGYAEEGEEVVTEALEVLPALAAVVGAPVGRPRAEALASAHEKTSALMTAVTDSSKSAAGIPGYAGDRSRLKEHGQKVRTAFADKLGGLVEDREATAGALGAMALNVATRQAQSAYGALLDSGALPAEPGPEVPGPPRGAEGLRRRGSCRAWRIHGRDDARRGPDGCHPSRSRRVRPRRFPRCSVHREAPRDRPGLRSLQAERRGSSVDTVHASDTQSQQLAPGDHLSGKARDLQALHDAGQAVEGPG
jgi:hypothetical protein